MGIAGTWAGMGCDGVRAELFWLVGLSWDAVCSELGVGLCWARSWTGLPVLLGCGLVWPGASLVWANGCAGEWDGLGLGWAGLGLGLYGLGAGMHPAVGLVLRWGSWAGLVCWLGCVVLLSRLGCWLFCGLGWGELLDGMGCAGSWSRVGTGFCW